ncbi:MAG: BON domain-containing protein [Planctomycetota bacterium]|nr:BON domain-containing protein [Planctomycetota bacterium]
MVRNFSPFLFLLLLLLSACSSTEPAEKAAMDMEIERAILWDFRKESRFDRVEVTCRDGVVLLQGIVPTMKDKAETVKRAQKAANKWDSGTDVVSELTVE